MRTPNMTLIHETFSLCFEQVLDTLGDRTKRVIYDYLERRGIDKADITSRFQDVENLLVQLYGQGGRTVLIGALAKFCEEYSVSLNLGYSDTLSNRMIQLTENILMQKLVPRHYRKFAETRMFEDMTGTSAGWTD